MGRPRRHALDRLADERGELEAMRGVGEAPLHEQEAPHNTEFFALVADVKGVLSRLEAKVHGKGGDEKSLAELFGSFEVFDEARLKEDIEELSAEIQGLAKEAQQKLKVLGADAADAEKGYTAAEVQMRKNMQVTLHKRTDALVTEFIALKKENSEKNQEKSIRQVKQVMWDTSTRDYKVNEETGSVYTEDELEQIATQCLETGTSVYMEGLAANALADVQAKHEVIMQIERNVNEVAQMFNDLALLVEVQGEQLDRIEENITRTYAHAKRGVEELHKANEVREQGRLLFVARNFPCEWLTKPSRCAPSSTNGTAGASTTIRALRCPVPPADCARRACAQEARPVPVLAADRAAVRDTRADLGHGGAQCMRCSHQQSPGISFA